MIKEIFENLFKPNDPEEVERRRCELYPKIQAFENDINWARAHSSGVGDMTIRAWNVIVAYLQDETAIEWEQVYHYLIYNDTAPADDEVLDLVDGYKKWKEGNANSSLGNTE